MITLKCIVIVKLVIPLSSLLAKLDFRRTGDPLCTPLLGEGGSVERQVAGALDQVKVLTDQGY